MKLRVMCWNIAEGRGYDPDGNWNDRDRIPATLPRIASQISNKSPDLVFLNEVRNERGWPIGNGINQIERLGELCGIPYRLWANTNELGIRGHKAVGILSRHATGAQTYRPVMSGSDTTGFGTLETTIELFGHTHHVFSTRFSPIHRGDPNEARELGENILGHDQAINFVNSVDPPRPIIFGGDFNSDPDSHQMLNFMSNSGLIDCLERRPDPQRQGGEVDHVFFRGPYEVMAMEVRRPWSDYSMISDHPWLYAELEVRQPTPECDQINLQISGMNDQIRLLEQQLADLDGSDPANQQERKEINAEIKRLREEVQGCRNRAAALGCW